MADVPSWYRRFDHRARELSRSGYALTVGTITFIVWLVIGVLFGDVVLFQATLSAISFAAIYYFVYPHLATAED